MIAGELFDISLLATVCRLNPVSNSKKVRGIAIQPLSQLFIDETRLGGTIETGDGISVRMSSFCSQPRSV